MPRWLLKRAWLSCPQNIGTLAKTYLLRDHILQFLERYTAASNELPLFFDRSGTYASTGIFVQSNYVCFLDFLVQIQGDFSKEIFCVFEKFWFWGTYPGGNV